MDLGFSQSRATLRIVEEKTKSEKTAEKSNSQIDITFATSVLVRQLKSFVSQKSGACMMGSTLSF